MDTLAKLASISKELSVELAEDVTSVGAPCGSGAETEAGIFHQAVMPGGKRITLLKTLLTSACERDCRYCAFRAGRDFRRATFTPDEMARAFADLARRGAAQGLFLSSGIAGGGVRIQDRLIDVVDLLRAKYGFRGYVHLKIMPGAEPDQIRRAMQLADRVSVNLEAPNQQRLAALAPHKVFTQELESRLQLIESIRREQGGGPSSTTQFVVGAVGESDAELLSTADRLIRQARLSRVYYSRFNPVSNTPFEDRPPADPTREHRLYQADFLLRQYGFEFGELAFDEQGNLPLQLDPKVAWARQHLAYTPVEINRADRRDLLRVPGIGPKTAEAILRGRRQGRIRDLADLRKLGANAGRAAPYILLDGRRPAHQLSLW